MEEGWELGEKRGIDEDWSFFFSIPKIIIDFVRKFTFTVAQFSVDWENMRSIRIFPLTIKRGGGGGGIKKKRGRQTDKKRDGILDSQLTVM